MVNFKLIPGFSVKYLIRNPRSKPMKIFLRTFGAYI